MQQKKFEKKRNLKAATRLYDKSVRASFHRPEDIRPTRPDHSY